MVLFRGSGSGPSGRVVLVGNSPRDRGTGGQWLGFIFIWWGIVPWWGVVLVLEPLGSYTGISILSHENEGDKCWEERFMELLNFYSSMILPFKYDLKNPRK